MSNKSLAKWLKMKTIYDNQLYFYTQATNDNINFLKKDVIYKATK